MQRLQLLPGRFADWWTSKTPLLLTIVYAGAVLNGGVPDAAVLGWFLLSYAGMAAYGYLLNDWYDRSIDAAAGKVNTLARTPGFAFVLYAFLAAAVGILPWWLTLPADGLAQGLILSEILLLSIYAIPPFRLKERGWIAVLTDCGYGFVLPFVLTAHVFVHAAVSSMAIAAFCGWLAAAGIRNILLHQLLDYENDIASGTATIATRLGLKKVRRLIHFRLAFAELICFLALCLALPHAFAWLPAFYLLYVVYAYWRELLVLRQAANVLKNGYNFICHILLNEFYEKWLPYLLLIPLCARHRAFIIVMLLHSLLFYPHVRAYYNEARMLWWKVRSKLQRIYHTHVKRLYLATYKLAKVTAFRLVYAPLRSLLRQKTK